MINILLNMPNYIYIEIKNRLYHKLQINQHKPSCVPIYVYYRSFKCIDLRHNRAWRSRNTVHNIYLNLKHFSQFQVWLKNGLIGKKIFINAWIIIYSRNRQSLSMHNDLVVGRPPTNWKIVGSNRARTYWLKTCLIWLLWQQFLSWKTKRLLTLYRTLYASIVKMHFFFIRAI